MLSPTEGRVQEIIADLQRCKTNGYMLPSEAESLFGRLGFVLRTTVGAIGRAATQPLLQRAHQQEGPFPFTLAMHHMLDFFDATLLSLPPLQLPCGPGRRSDGADDTAIAILVTAME